MKNKVKIIGIIGIIGLIFLIFGITYAVFTWVSDPTGGFINATSECFVIDYTKGEDILDGTLVFGNDYTTGLSTTVKAKISDNCPTIKGIATLYVDVKDDTSDYFIENGILRYQILEDNVEVKSGVLTSKGKNEVYSDIEITYTEKVFTIYIWANKNDINDDNIEIVSNSTYSVGIQMSAEGR